MRKLSGLLGLWLFTLLSTASISAQVQSDREGRKLPLPSSDDVFHFMIYGDRTGGPAEGIKVLEEAVSDTNLLDPDLVMTVGDLIQGYNQTDEWMTQMKEFRSVMGKLRMPWFPVAGNHDIYWRGPDKPPGEHEKSYETHFGPLWYWFKHKNAGFVALYTEEGDPKTGLKQFGKTDRMSDRQFEWLKRSLSDIEGVDHIFVFLHHPRWIERRYPTSDWDRVHKILAKNGKVRACFAGHIHRMHFAGKRDGIEYFALATTGGSMPGDHPTVGYVHHMNVVSVRKDSYSVSALPVGAVLDPRQYTEKREQEVDRLRRESFADIGRIEIGNKGEANGKFAFTIKNPSERPIEVDTLAEFEALNWMVQPEHDHVKIEAGASRKIEMTISRRSSEFDTSFSNFKAPRIRVRIDYLEESARVQLPPRYVSVPVSPKSVPASFFEAPEGSFVLDGKGDAIRINSSALKLPQGAFTVEARIRAESFASRQLVISKLENSEFGLQLSDGKPSFLVHLGGKYAIARAEKALEAKRWHHIAGVFNGSSVRLFVDGKLAANIDASGRRTTTSRPLFVGADTNSSNRPIDFFHGRIDEVRISTGARYEGESFEPSRRHTPDDTTVLLLHGDRDLGPFAIDHSKERANGMLLGNAAAKPE